MTVTRVSTMKGNHSVTTREQEKNSVTDLSKDKSSEKTVDFEPRSDTWKTVAAGAIVPLGLAGSAVWVTYLTSHEQVAMTAWIAVAVVGSASVISSAIVSRRRIETVDESEQGEKPVSPHKSAHKNSIE